jgi:transcriptional regulator with XRE-family HTH domain
MTQQQLGLSLQPPATRASVANIESGKQRVLAHTLVQLAAALEAEVADLLTFRTSAASAADVRIAHELQVKVGLAQRQVREITAHLKTGPE